MKTITADALQWEHKHSSGTVVQYVASKGFLTHSPSAVKNFILYSHHLVSVTVAQKDPELA